MRRCTEKVNAEFVNSLMWKRGFTTQLQSWRPSYTDLSRQLTREGRMRICLNVLWKVGSWEGARGSLYMGEGRTEGLHTFPTPLGAPLSLWGRALDFCHFFAFIRGARKRKNLKMGMREGTDICKDKWWGLWRVEKAENLTKAKTKTKTWPKLDQGKGEDQHLTKTWQRLRQRPILDQDKSSWLDQNQYQALTKTWFNIWPFRCQCWQPDLISQSETCLDGFIEDRGSILRNAGESSVQNDMLDQIQNFWQKIQTIRLKFCVEGHL